MNFWDGFWEAFNILWASIDNPRNPADGQWFNWKPLSDWIHEIPERYILFCVLSFTFIGLMFYYLIRGMKN